MVRYIVATRASSDSLVILYNFWQLSMSVTQFESEWDYNI